MPQKCATALGRVSESFESIEMVFVLICSHLPQQQQQQQYQKKTTKKPNDRINSQHLKRSIRPAYEIEYVNAVLRLRLRVSAISLVSCSCYINQSTIKLLNNKKEMLDVSFRTREEKKTKYIGKKTKTKTTF